MTYEYVCEACGHLWEAEQSIKDSALKKCVSCGKSKARRLVSGGTGFLLKGGGWYADGYGSPGAAASKAKSDEKTGAKGNAKAEGGDTKAVDSKSAEGKSGDSKSADSKSGGEEKAGDSKVAADKGTSSAGATAPASGSAKAS